MSLRPLLLRPNGAALHRHLHDPRFQSNGLMSCFPVKAHFCTRIRANPLVRDRRRRLVATLSLKTETIVFANSTSLKPGPHIEVGFSHVRAVRP